MLGTKAAIDRLDHRVEALSSEMAAEFRAVRAEHRADFRLLAGLILTTTGAMLAVMAHGFPLVPLRLLRGDLHLAQIRLADQRILPQLRRRA